MSQIWHSGERKRDARHRPEVTERRGTRREEYIALLPHRLYVSAALTALADIVNMHSDLALA